MIKLLFIVPDLSEPIFRTRLDQLNLNFDVELLGFERNNGTSFSIDNKVVGKGRIRDKRYLRRTFSYFGAVAKVFLRYYRQPAPDIIYARNLDLLIVALLIRIIVNRKASVVYEVLDIHPSFNNGKYQKVLRYLEKYCIEKCDSVVVSSNGFSSYLQKNYNLDNIIIQENRINDKHRHYFRPEILNFEHPIKIGFFGKIRCQTSLELLFDYCRAWPEEVQLRIAGIIPNNLEETISTGRELQNVEILGPYDHPQGLQSLYDGCHFCWAVDNHDHVNSPLLLPNRVYEAIAAGIPSLGLQDTEVGKFLQVNEVGLVMDDLTVNGLRALLFNIKKPDYDKLRDSVMNHQNLAYWGAQHTVEFNGLIAPQIN